MNALGRSRWLQFGYSGLRVWGLLSAYSVCLYDFNSLCLTLTSSDDGQGQILHDDKSYCLYCTEVHDTILSSSSFNPAAAFLWYALSYRLAHLHPRDFISPLDSIIACVKAHHHHLAGNISTPKSDGAGNIFMPVALSILCV